MTLLLSSSPTVLAANQTVAVKCAATPDVQALSELAGGCLGGCILAEQLWVHPEACARRCRACVGQRGSGWPARRRAISFSLILARKPRLAGKYQEIPGIFHGTGIYPIAAALGMRGRSSFPVRMKLQAFTLSRSLILSLVRTSLY